MNIVDVWRDVSKRIGFFTKETCHSIPQSSGIYAWFIPLWIYSEDASEFQSLIHQLLAYDPISRGPPSRRSRVRFNWEQIDVHLQKTFSAKLTPKLLEQWDDMLQDSVQRSAFAQALMEASILLPPLYVGKADNLRERYDQHVKGTDLKDNTFHNRFTQYSAECTKVLRVSDLLFVCISFDAHTSTVLRGSHLNTLLEQLLMRLAAPSFSIK